MEPMILVEDGEKYCGEYVVTSSFRGKKVITHGEDPVKVYNTAKIKGIKEPVLIYIPQKDMIHIY